MDRFAELKAAFAQWETNHGSDYEAGTLTAWDIFAAGFNAGRKPRKS